MFQFSNDIIAQFKPCFKRVTTWLSFTCIIMGFMVRTDVRHKLGYRGAVHGS
ncbi:MAG: hypothetical protein LBT14_11760 [Treponema sp.]|nr:hypothetical protein [Treponema sp.]